ncbi:MAG: hypothetical protein ACW964_08920 [Candidatus Hodarchaeales archaeon]|jgi:hypothetical protein
MRCNYLNATLAGIKIFRYDYLDYLKPNLPTLPSISSKTIYRTLKVIRLLQLTNEFYILDIAKLRFETYPTIRHNQLPQEMKNYFYFTSELPVGSFSLVQIPVKRIMIFII